MSTGVYFMPVFRVVFSFIFFPILFICNPYLSYSETSEYVYIPLCYFLLLLNDFFAIAQAGDWKGRDFCTTSLSLTLLTSSITLSFVLVKIVVQKNKLESILSIGYPKVIEMCGFMIVVICATLAVRRLYASSS